MRRDRTIAVVGVSDEEAAHLRLLVRRCEAELEGRWVWGEGEDVDLLVVDPESFAGQMARARAQAGGVRVAVFSDQTEAGTELVLRRPLLRANVVEVLNEITRAAVRGPVFGANTDDFYTRDVGNEDADPAASAAPQAADGLDALLRPLPRELRDVPPPPAPGPAMSPASPLPTHAPKATLPAARAPSRAAALAELEPRSLREWLHDGLLGAPVCVELPGEAPLVLDPKHSMAYTPGSLVALRAHCHARWAMRDWRPLTSAELVRASATQNAIAYARITWLDALEHSGGRLASHLDPAGTYCLRQWMEIDRELGTTFRIATSLLKPLRLHEVAAASGATMGDVFDVVNAYAAIGLIECQPRQRDGPAPESLLKRLGKPFTKRS
ncbi:hypothetical protein [Dokdonella sp.]|uniref:hypothetical protein n=1 Tax=Dokdonella sp. TaxID=2291710 RepID=UPI003AF6CD5F